MSDQKITLEAIRQVIKDEIKPVEERFDKKVDRVLTAVDGVAKSLKTIREEQAGMNYAIIENRKDIDSLDVRVDKLEARA